MKRAAKISDQKEAGRRDAEEFIAQLLQRTPSWISTDGDGDDIISSTRIRLARNLKLAPFPGTAREEELQHVISQVENACKGIRLFQDARYVSMDDLDPIDRKILVERRLISPLFAEKKSSGMAIIEASENLCIMVNEEDHLRIQSIQPGLGLQEAWRLISRLDDELSEQLEYAFSPQFGYLTACPTNVGTGMRASILIHLAALSMNGEVEKFIKELAPNEIAVRGFYGEGTEVLGNIFQISNQVTLGRTETATVSRLEIVAHKFLDLERAAREKLLATKRTELEDRVYRALAILQNARVISSLEFMTHYSMVKLGVDLELIHNLDSGILSELMIFTQPAHMQKFHEHLTDSESRDILRAKIIREKVAAS